jgi:hypothetical protein
MSALDLLVRTIKSQKFGRPFYSKLDEALENLPRQKGTAEEFMRELEKQPGVKKAEIEDRGIRKALANRAKAPDAKKPITKEQMQKILYDQAPFPPVIEGGYGGKDVKYQKYSTPGGKNYREILLKLPEDYLNEPYMTDHFGDEPNILAHIRVSDFNTPDGKKVLLVDEMQSDWHQAGRSEGYYSPYAQRNLDVDKRLYEYAQEDKEKAKAAMEAAQAAGDNPAYEASRDKYLDLVQRSMTLDTQIAKQKQELERGVPEAPFKKNWHELAMKRVLDYAAGNGYDTVAITPGAEQAKRYDLSKRINDLEWDSETNTLTAWDHNGISVINEKGVSQENLPNYVGKEVAERLLKGEDPKKQLFGADLQVGGEGMKGFYDKILPDYLNNFGKQYGASVGQISLKTPSSTSWNIEDAARFHGMSGAEYLDNPNRPQLEKQFLESRENQTTGFHSFDITPQLRDEVKSKGLPLYSKMGMGPEGLAAGTGAATIGSEVFDANNEQQVQNPVHFTENPDAMLLELMQRN